MRRRTARTKRCSEIGKVSFRDEASAKRALRTMRKRSQRDRVPDRTYQCPACKQWHLTAAKEHGW